MAQQNEWLSWAEDRADLIARRGKHVLPIIARACLVSTFFEDGIRMWTQWNEQREYMDISWGCGWFLATMFVVINLIGQLGGVIMVMGKLKVEIACGVLFFYCLLTDHCLQYFVGYAVPIPKFGTGWSLTFGLGRITSRGKIDDSWNTITWRKQT